MALPEEDGWERRGRRTHGIFYSKLFPGETFPRSTVIPDKSDDLPTGILGAILGVKQTGIGRGGLQDWIDKYELS